MTTQDPCERTGKQAANLEWAENSAVLYTRHSPLAFTISRQRDDSLHSMRIVLWGTWSHPCLHSSTGSTIRRALSSACCQWREPPSSAEAWCQSVLQRRCLDGAVATTCNDWSRDAETVVHRPRAQAEPPPAAGRNESTGSIGRRRQRREGWFPI